MKLKVNLFWGEEKNLYESFLPSCTALKISSGYSVWVQVFMFIGIVLLCSSSEVGTRGQKRFFQNISAYSHLL